MWPSLQFKYVYPTAKSKPVFRMGTLLAFGAKKCSSHGTTLHIALEDYNIHLSLLRWQHDKMLLTMWLKEQTLLFHSSGAEKCKVKAPGSDESPLPGLQTAVHQLRPCVVASVSPRVSFSSQKHTNPILGTLPSWAHLNLILSQRLHLQYHHIREQGFSLWMGRVVDKIQSTVTPLVCTH